MSDLKKPASVLAFERKLDPSDGIFHAGQWKQRSTDDGWQPVRLREKSVRGTISNRLKADAQDLAKLDAAIQSPNLQTVDVAMLPPDCDTLRLHFTLRILSGVGQPSACNDAAYQDKLSTVVAQYLDNTGLSELARRYAHNLANARFLWRNRLGAETVEVTVRQLQHGEKVEKWSFDALNYSLRDFEGGDDRLQSLAATIEQGLTSGPVLLEVTTHARMGPGQEVYPSQELILDGGSKGKKSKTLYAVDGIAAMHSQKIGNALRTIDTWYPDAETLGLGPIAVEPYGSVTSRGTAYRQPQQKQDFYNLFDGWVIKDKTPEVEQQHFVMATLIRGGVFGEGKE